MTTSTIAPSVVKSEGPRIVRPNGMKAWIARNSGWVYDNHLITKHYTFGDACEAARFAAISVRRASKADIRLTLKTHGSAVSLTIAPPGEDFTSNELRAARRFDVIPPANAKSGS